MLEFAEPAEKLFQIGKTGTSMKSKYIILCLDVNVLEKQRLFACAPIVSHQNCQIQIIVLIQLCMKF